MRQLSRARPVLAVGLLLLVAADAPADAPRPVAARCISETASLVRREAPDKPWFIVARNESLQVGDLIVGADDATFESNNGAVRASIVGDLGRQSPFPILETAVTLQPAADVDLSLALERGRIDLTNHKVNGPAVIRLTVRNVTGTLTLANPGDRVAFEIYGRWLRGSRFNRELKAGEAPALAVVLLALKGDIQVKARRELTLSAPPGPALLMFDDLNDPDFRPRHLDTIPAWASGAALSERARKVQATLARFRRLAVEQGLDAATGALFHSDDEIDRRVAVCLCGALDDLPRLGDVLQFAKQPDVWDTGVTVLRHWLGRAPGQDQLLYAALVEKAKMPPAQADTVMQLLHGFSDDDLNRPATYAALLDYLESERLALRGLAHWHLVRLLPAGADIKFNPVAPKSEREKAVQEWRKLIPPGKVPPGVWRNYN